MLFSSVISATFQDTPETYRESSFYTLDNFVLPTKAEIQPELKLLMIWLKHRKSNNVLK